MKSPDQLIDSEIQALRSVDAPNPGAAIQAMQRPPSTGRKSLLALKLSLGTAALAGIAILGSGLVAKRADASELKAIGAAQKAQRVQHSVQLITQPATGKFPAKSWSNEIWTDNDKYCYIERSDTGTIISYSGFDGKHTFRYLDMSSPGPGIPPIHSYDIDETPPTSWDFVTIDGYLNDPLLMKGFSCTKGVSFKGKTYDLYFFMKGFFHIYVDPETRLPARRECYTGNTLFESDLYDYPTSIPADRFSPPNNLPLKPTVHPAKWRRADGSIIQEPVGTAKTVAPDAGY